MYVKNSIKLVRVYLTQIAVDVLYLYVSRVGEVSIIAFRWTATDFKDRKFTARVNRDTLVIGKACGIECREANIVLAD